MLLTPGLYKIERAVLLLYLIATPVLSITGAAVVYYCIFLLASRPCSHQFMFAFGAAFQIPVILTLMVRVSLPLALIPNSAPSSQDSSISVIPSLYEKSNNNNKKKSNSKQQQQQ
ncbi:Sec-independent protein translocase protein TatC [Dirofilaria immitis]